MKRFYDVNGRQFANLEEAKEYAESLPNDLIEAVDLEDGQEFLIATYRRVEARWIRSNV